jgi:histidyl-tRNA synthetase
MGDVTMRDFLETHKLMPEFKSVAHLFIGTIGKEYIEGAQALAERLRRKELNVAVNITDKKIGDQIKRASKDTIPFFISFGENELASQVYPLKNLATKEEKKVPESELPDVILSSEA